MTQQGIQDILPMVETPSRYLGTEVNRASKDPESADLHIALAFPDLYEIGTSHFGLQILYHIINGTDNFMAERVYAPASDLATQLKSKSIPLTSLESQTPLMDFDVIGFSLLYELNYTNMLNMLELSGIPFLKSQRDSSHPLLIAGGPCTVNPEPVADFFDAMVVGDGESVILEVCHTLAMWKKEVVRGKTENLPDRDSLLKNLSLIQGVYVPSFFKSHYDSSGFGAVTPIFKEYSTIKRAVVPSLDSAPYPDHPIVPYGRPVHDRLRIEIARGCTRGCRFCQAGMIYRPVRERRPDHVLSILESSLKSTGHEDVSMMSLSTGDYGCITEVVHKLMLTSKHEHIAVSLPSLRAGTLSPELMGLIKKVRKTGFTIACEAGSQRLRDVINKNIDEKAIVETVENAFSLGWKVIKLYFMIGLPTETLEDLEAIVALVKKLKDIKKPGPGSAQINVSITTFIPKSHTPFQWASQLSLDQSRDKIQWLKSELHFPGVKVKWQDPDVSFIEGLMARGDRSMSRLLIKAYELGCRFDGWSDSFDMNKWMAAIRESEIDPDFFITRSRDLAEKFPWDHIDVGVNKDYLITEKKRAEELLLTDDCRYGDCTACGVCDFKNIKPEVFHDFALKPDEIRAEEETATPADYPIYHLHYEKRGTARFFGHLEMIKIFLRAFRRARMPLKYSEGYHPLPKVSFDNPLPLGMESEQEQFFIVLTAQIDTTEMKILLNNHLPQGLTILSCVRTSGKKKIVAQDPITYDIVINNGFFDENCLKWFYQTDEIIIEKTTKKRKKLYLNLKDHIVFMTCTNPQQLCITIASRHGKLLRPVEVVYRIFNLPEEILHQARIIKRTEIIQ
ncbi:MAG: TIGR03960 family B12-binding radical SAM protein [Desulfobacteraceae bacterium]|nr:TIGR03960 family B12-binding radical SAM protein [Desulfobacteraceae bacterium]